MIVVYGASDDLIEVDGSVRDEFSADVEDSAVVPVEGEGR
jgi:hypothetical protein